MASFHYREGTPRRSRLLTAQMSAVLVTSIIIAAVLIAKEHPMAGLSVLAIAVLFTAIDTFRVMRVRKATGAWEIAIDDASFRWSSPSPSLGPTIVLPIKAIKSLVITRYAWSEVGSDKDYHLVLEDGSRMQLWGWGNVPMDNIAECLKSSGVTLVRENA